MTLSQLLTLPLCSLPWLLLFISHFPSETKIFDVLTNFLDSVPSLSASSPAWCHHFSLSVAAPSWDDSQVCISVQSLTRGPSLYIKFVSEISTQMYPRHHICNMCKTEHLIINPPTHDSSSPIFPNIPTEKTTNFLTSNSLSQKAHTVLSTVYLNCKMRTSSSMSPPPRKCIAALDLFQAPSRTFSLFSCKNAFTKE